jgi:hypothetical protein
MKTRRMGQAAEKLLTAPEEMTGAEALEQITGSTVTSAKSAPRKAPRRAPSKSRPPVERRPAAKTITRTKSAEETPAKYVVTSMRIRRAHWLALHEEAIRMIGDSSSRPDLSGALRSVLDDWLAHRQ